MGTFYNPPPPFVGGAQPYAQKESAVIQGGAAPPPVDNPPFRSVAGALVAVLVAWIPPPPAPFMGGREPLQARTLPPSLLDVPVNLPSGNSQVMRVVTVAPVPPQLPCKLNPKLLDVPAGTVLRRPEVPAGVVAAWQLAAPQPQTSIKFVQVNVAAAADTVTRGALVPPAVYVWWQPPDPPPTQAKKLYPSLLDVSVNLPSGNAQVMRVVEVKPIPPQLPRKLNPALLNVVSAQVDDPPFGYKPYKGWSYVNDLTLLISPQGAPEFVLTTIDDPPFSQRRELQWANWQRNDPPPTLPRYIVQPAAPAVVNDPPFSGRKTWDWANWRQPDPLPTLRSKLPGVLLDVPVDRPPFLGTPRIVTRYPDPLPTLPPKIAAAIAPAVVVNEPPYGIRPWLATVLQSWQPPLPLPTLAGKLPPAITAVRVDNPPIMRIGDFWTIQSWWRPADPPLPQTTRFLSSSARVDNPPITRLGDFWTVQSWWNPPPVPLPQVAPKILIEGVTPPPPVSVGSTGGQGGYITRKKWEELRKLLAAQRAAEAKAREVKSLPAQQALAQAAGEALLAAGHVDQDTPDKEIARLTRLLEAAVSAKSLAQTIKQAEAAQKYAERMVLEAD